MLKGPEIFKKFEDEFVRDKGRLSLSSAMKLLDAMWQEGIILGILPPKEPLEGIDVDIKIAKTLNSCLKKSSQE